MFSVDEAAEGTELWRARRVWESDERFANTTTFALDWWGIYVEGRVGTKVEIATWKNHVCAEFILSYQSLWNNHITINFFWYVYTVLLFRSSAQLHPILLWAGTNKVVRLKYQSSPLSCQTDVALHYHPTGILCWNIHKCTFELYLWT